VEVVEVVEVGEVGEGWRLGERVPASWSKEFRR
jgi:hypothetical protein